MKIRDFVETFEMIVSASDPDVIAKIQSDPNNWHRMSQLLEQLEKYSSSSVDIVTDRLNEEFFVKFLIMVEKLAVTMLIVDDNSSKTGTFMLAQAAGTGVLQTYTQSAVMAVLGALVDEEVL